MSRNHRNRSWRQQWTVDPVSMTATHKSGLVIQVSGDTYACLNADIVVGTRWENDLEKLKTRGAKVLSPTPEITD